MLGSHHFRDTLVSYG